MKTYNIQSSLGKSKYVINYHNGTSFHKDGSPFFDIKIFTNKTTLNLAIKELEYEGYVKN